MRASRSAFASAAEEAAFKNARNYGGAAISRPPVQARAPALRHIIVSCERADLRPLPNGVMIYQDGTARLDPLPPPDDSARRGDRRAVRRGRRRQAAAARRRLGDGDARSVPRDAAVRARGARHCAVRHQVGTLIRPVIARRRNAPRFVRLSALHQPHELAHQRRPAKDPLAAQARDAGEHVDQVPGDRAARVLQGRRGEPVRHSGLELPHAHERDGAPEVDVRRRDLARHRRAGSAGRSAEVPRRAPLYRPPQGRPHQDRAERCRSSSASAGSKACRS